MMMRPSILLQLAPPCALIFLASTTHGISLLIVSGFCLLFGIFSLTRVIYLLAQSQQSQVSFLRAVLAAFICMLVVGGTQYSLANAQQFGAATAMQLRDACKVRQQCPSVPSGWVPRADAYSAQTQFGDRVQWGFVYRADGTKFELRLLKGLDLVEVWN